MARINSHYLKLTAGYLFPEIARRVAAFGREHPDARLLRLGIGDVTRPLPPAVVEALHRGVEEMGHAETFKGYGPEQGYAFLRELIAEHDYRARSVELSPDEIFVSDGSKCDCGNVQEIFDERARVAVADPVYPVYVDTNVMAGRTGPADGKGRYGGIVYMPCAESAGFLPEPPREPVDLVYLCFPNNPNGRRRISEVLARWVDYAKKNDAILLFDAAYEAYISDPAVPHSIYEVDGAREVAIEFRSFSKTAGFTGTRCAFLVVPRELTGKDVGGSRHSIHALWSRRHSTKFNGVRTPSRRGPLLYTQLPGRRRSTSSSHTTWRTRGGSGRVFRPRATPFSEASTPPTSGSRLRRGPPRGSFFDRLLQKAHVVGTPGSGFGPSGEVYLRLSAFGERANVEEAVERIRKPASKGRRRGRRPRLHTRWPPKSTSASI
jgi:LL-diaminopimelate aminotransferase